MRGFVGGFIVALLVLAVAGFAAIELGMLPARADGGFLPGEKWAAHTSLDATIKREAPKAPYPYSDNAEAQTNGATLYVQNCAVCHGTAHSTPNSIAHGLGVPPPNFTRHGVDDDPPGETYWKIEHGIRFTGMPAFDKSLDEKSLWDIAFFLAHKPAELAPAARAIWENPASVPAPTPMPAPPSRPG
ncbi:MAG: c-type cytochrome [Vulcanimicrobiaceae bacterium]